MVGAFLRRRDRTVRSLRVEHYSSAVNTARTRGELDEGRYPTGRQVSDEQMDTLSIKRDVLHGEWN